MAKNFQHLTQKQVQKSLDDFFQCRGRQVKLKRGWIKMYREALGMPSIILAERLGCKPSNVTMIEQREKKGTVTIQTLEEVASALDCQLIYAFVPKFTLEELLEQRARSVARARIERINHSMQLEAQGLTKRQLQEQEDDLVSQLLMGNPKQLWSDDEI